MYITVLLSESSVYIMYISTDNLNLSAHHAVLLLIKNV